ncbi:MAG: AAA family ATPase [Asgard group archaeon]|nr:AAA family ATPase [Asgard group archaeon]
MEGLFRRRYVNFYDKFGCLILTEGILDFSSLENLLFGEKINLEKLQGQLIHIYGEAGTGKTTLALQIACGICSQGEKVVFIDTEGKVTGSKIQQMLKNSDLEQANSLLKLYIPTSFQEQHELIQKLEFFTNNQKIAAIIIDTITNLYRQESDLLNEDKRLYKQLTFQVALLQKLAKKKLFPIILFNQATMAKIDDQDFLSNLKRERVNPVAKAIISYWADREIILVSYGYDKYEARIPSEFEGRVKFSIDSNGIIPQK